MLGYYVLSALKIIRRSKMHGTYLMNEPGTARGLARTPCCPCDLSRATMINCAHPLMETCV